MTSGHEFFGVTATIVHGLSEAAVQCPGVSDIEFIPAGENFSAILAIYGNVPPDVAAALAAGTVAHLSSENGQKIYLGKTYLVDFVEGSVAE